MGDLAGFPPLVRVQVEQLACCQPAGLDLHLTHWSSRSLAQVAAIRGVVPHIAHSTVSLMLRRATLQPHRYRYWKTPTLDAEFVKRASPILWCYEHIERLWERGELVLCWDEKPNVQALERRRHLMRAEQVERLEFEYTRHGTVNFGVVLVVGEGTMASWCLEANDSEHLCPVLAELFEEVRGVRRVHLIWDNGPSHISDYTQRFLRSYKGWVRVLPTPVHAGWLNQAELLLHAFSARYLHRGSWTSRRLLMEHLLGSTVEYNRRFAHPFKWSWTRSDMHRWIERSSA